MPESKESKHDQWDYETATVRPPARAPKAVFSIRVDAREMSAIRRAARAAGVTTSEFIRSAALARAEGVEAPQPHQLVQTSRLTFVEAYSESQAPGSVSITGGEVVTPASG